MTFRVLADVVVVVHFAFVVFVLLGGLLVLRWPRVAWVQLPAAAWGAWVELAGRICPLTPLENALRARGGGDAYATSFVEHHLVPILYPASLTHDLQLVLGALVLIVNAAVYAHVLRRRHPHPASSRSQGRV